ncbi:MAG: VRR-NUC domain-containing protein [Cellvibrio sp.]
MSWVVNRYTDLLTQDELNFVRIFESLPQGSQCLYVRLASRAGNLFRADKIKYAEIECIESSALHLVHAGLIDIHVSLNVSDLSRVLTKPELQHLFGQNHKSERRCDLIDRVAQQYPETKDWHEWTSGIFGHLYRLKWQELLNTFTLLFFGNTHQNLTEFVLQDLGIFRYENYQIDHQYRIFKTRDELSLFQKLSNLREQCELATLNEELVCIAMQIPASVSSEILLRRKSKLCNKLANALVRHNNHSLAIELYRQSHLAPARECRIRLLEKQGMYAEAWELLEAVSKNPIDEQELQIFGRLSSRISKKLGRPVIPIINPQLNEKSIFLNKFNGESRVEEIVRQHINCDSSPCIYVENQLFLGLFGLWLWPEMFRGVDGAFANPFQSAPLDMYEQNFTDKRLKITELFELFESDIYKDHIKHIWKTKLGLANHFVNWNFLNENLIDLALESIPANHLKLIFKRILFDIRNNRSGLPDLIQFFPESRSYLLIEVKGPGDRIQDNQRRWFNYFSEHNIPAEVLYVSWQ